MKNAERMRRYREQKQAEWGLLPKIPCACGCETLISPMTRSGRPAQYALGHSSRITQKGRKHSPEHIAKWKASRLANSGGVWKTHPPGWKPSAETRMKMSEAQHRRGLTGEGNPFFGKHHAQGTKDAIAAKKTGPLAPNWKGGVQTLPYGPEFTNKFKRLIRERDNHTCQRCGKTREQEGRTLHVHHIDNDMWHNDPINLVTLCARCHGWLRCHKDEPFAPLPYGA